MGRFRKTGKVGFNRFRFQGWIKGKPLAMGPHRLVARATDSDGMTSRDRRRGFKVIARLSLMATAAASPRRAW